MNNKGANTQIIASHGPERVITITIDPSILARPSTQNRITWHGDYEASCSACPRVELHNVFFLIPANDLKHCVRDSRHDLLDLFRSKIMSPLYCFTAISRNTSVK